MKCSLITVLSIISNVLLIQGQKQENKQITDTEVSKALTFKSILEDINSFYSQKDEQPIISLNPNVKAQLSNDGANGGNDNAGNADGGNANAGDTNKADNAGDAGKTDNADNAGNAGNTGNTGNANNAGNAGNAGDANKNANPFPQNSKDENNKNNKIGDAEDDEEPLKETGCGTNRASLGMFAFHRPIRKR